MTILDFPDSALQAYAKGINALNPGAFCHEPILQSLHAASYQWNAITRICIRSYLLPRCLRYIRHNLILPNLTPHYNEQLGPQDNSKTTSPGLLPLKTITARVINGGDRAWGPKDSNAKWKQGSICHSGIQDHEIRYSNITMRVGSKEAFVTVVYKIRNFVTLRGKITKSVTRINRCESRIREDARWQLKCSREGEISDDGAISTRIQKIQSQLHNNTKVTKHIGQFSVDQRSSNDL